MVLAETFGNFAFAIACRVLGLRDLGPAISPFNAFLILTGIETLPLRMQRHCDNALAVARHLARRPRQGRLGQLCRACRGDRYHELAQNYCPRAPARVFTFGLKGGYEAGVALVSEAQTVLPPRQYRRHALARHPPGLDHAPATVRRAEGARRRRAGHGAALDRDRGCGGYYWGFGAGVGGGVNTAE